MHTQNSTASSTFSLLNGPQWLVDDDAPCLLVSTRLMTNMPVSLVTTRLMTNMPVSLVTTRLMTKMPVFLVTTRLMMKMLMKMPVSRTLSRGTRLFVQASIGGWRHNPQCSPRRPVVSAPSRLVRTARLSCTPAGGGTPLRERRAA